MFLPDSILIEIYSRSSPHFPSHRRISEKDILIIWEYDGLLTIEGEYGSISGSSIKDDILSWEIHIDSLWGIWKTEEWDEWVNADDTNIILPILRCSQCEIPSSWCSTYRSIHSSERGIRVLDEAWFECIILLHWSNQSEDEFLSELWWIELFFSDSQGKSIVYILSSWCTQGEIILQWRKSDHTGSDTVSIKGKSLICNRKIIVLELPFESEGELKSHFPCLYHENTRILMEKIPIEYQGNPKKKKQNNERENSRTHRKICNWTYYRQNR